MDLGISGRKAIVCASSRGLGRGCALALAQAGCEVIDSLCAKQFGRIVNITSGSVKMPLVGLDLSSGARAGLTAFLAGVARSVAGSNVTINFLLPGAFDTDRLASNVALNAKKRGISIEEARKERMASVPAKRFGTPEEFGAACAFLCSAQ